MEASYIVQYINETTILMLFCYIYFNYCKKTKKKKTNNNNF